MRAIKILLIVVGALGLLLGVGVFLLNRYVQSPAFKQAVLDVAHGALDSDVTVSGMHVSLFTGATLERVVVVNPPGFPGNLLTADALVLRYRLLPLLRRRLEMAQVSLERPVLRLVRGDKEVWNYQKIGPKPSQAQSPARTSGPIDPSPQGTLLPTLDVVLPKLSVNDGRIVLTGERGRVLARADQVDLATSVSWAGQILSGNGKVSIETLRVAETLFVNRLAAPVSFTSSEVKVAPLSGKLADGDVLGDLTLTLAGSAKYVANAQVKNADVERLLREAGATRRPVRGKLQAQATFEGTGGLPALVGNGRAEILGGALIDVPILNTLAVALQVPVLRDLRFEECRIEFTLAKNVLQTPVIRLTARDVRITGEGAVSLATATLDHRLTLALTKGILDRAPREIRAAFTERPDGFRTVDFRVWGPYDAPKTDLQDRVLKGVTEQFLRRGLQKLFK